MAPRVGGAAVTLEERLEHYRRTSGFPTSLAIGEDGRLFGMWVLGNDYRSKQQYWGEYPPNYLRRVRALFPDKEQTLHLFAGAVNLNAWPGETVDLNADLRPTYVDDAQTLKQVPLHQYDVVLADPPYSGEDAERYGTMMVKRNRVFSALDRLSPGAHVVWLDQMLPMYRGDLFATVGYVGIVRSTNHRFRVMTIFERR